MNERPTLLAFMGTLAAIVAVALMARLDGAGDSLRLLDTIAVGLIGVIGTFRPRSAAGEPPAAPPRAPAEAPAPLPERPSWEA